MKRNIVIGAAIAALILVPAPLFAADAASEVVTAGTHADLAAKASDLTSVQMHLHHALNCLVGPGGKDFDTKNLNPCANAGNGAIPDEADAGKKAKLEAAANTLRAGIAAKDLKTAQNDATSAANELKAVK